MAARCFFFYVQTSGFDEHVKGCQSNQDVSNAGEQISRRDSPAGFRSDHLSRALKVHQRRLDQGRVLELTAGL